MKNLVFAALLVGGLSQATGCIIVSDDDDTVETSTFLVSWNLQTGESNPAGAAIGCGDAGVDTIRAVSQPVGGAPIVDLFDCIDGAHETAPLPLREYDVWVEGLDAAEVALAQSFSQDATLVDASPVALGFDFYVDAGFFGLTWTLTDSGSQISCETNDAISVISTPVSNTATFFDDIFDCVDGQGVTAPLPLDQYTLAIDIVDDQGTADTADDVSLTDSPATRTETLDLGNEMIDLGNFEFDFTP